MKFRNRFFNAIRKSLPTTGAACGLSVISFALWGVEPLGIAAITAALVWAGVVFLGYFAGAVAGWFRRVLPAPALAALDQRIATLGDKPSLENTDYDSLVAYFAAGVKAYRSTGCGLVLYPGLPGTQGLRTEQMEGFTRTASLFAAWVRTRGDLVLLADGSTFDAFGHLVAGLQSGTNPHSPEYWGPATDYSQRIVEAADIALVAWMLRDRLRAALPPAGQEALLAWLSTVANKRIYDGNWNLFPMIVGLGLEAWGAPSSKELIRAHYEEFKRAYVGDGWFGDDVGGRVDYYNVWQMQYFLYFAMQMSPGLDSAFIQDVIIRFADKYRYFFSPHGFPIFGRSAGYRMALPAPLVLASSLANSTVAPAQARRALDAIWAYFIGQGALSAGTVTQGYALAQPEIMENYGGRSSCLWSLRSLVAAYWLPPSAPLWTEPPVPLPVEMGSYDIHIAPAGLRVVGNHDTGTVEVRPEANVGAIDLPLERLGLLRQVAQILLRRPLRPDNFAAKYRRAVYRSDKPFCDS